MPNALAAVTCSRCLMVNVCARASRANPTQPTIDNAMTAFMMPGPSRPARAMASSIPGKAMNISIINTLILSHQPPNQAANTPMIVPTTNEINTTLNATSNEVLAPMIIRSAIGRPRSSYPSQACHSGSASIFCKIISSGRSDNKVALSASRHHADSTITGKDK